jgi:hypothetical protein
MTVLIGFSFPDLTVLVADSRGVADNDPADVDDNIQKLHRTTFGLIGGAGRSDVVESVIARLANGAPASHAEAEALIRDEVAKTGLPSDHPALERTSWLASFNGLTERGPESRLALVTPGGNYEFRHFPHNHVALLAPAGMSNEMGRHFRTEAQARFDRRIRDAPSEHRVQLCAWLADGLVKTIAAQNASVSPRWSIGYHDANNLVGVSAVGDDPEAILWS